jgi:hypothetical protein
MKAKKKKVEYFYPFQFIPSREARAIRVLVELFWRGNRNIRTYANGQSLETIEMQLGTLARALHYALDVPRYASTEIDSAFDIVWRSLRDRDVTPAHVGKDMGKGWTS